MSMSSSFGLRHSFVIQRQSGSDHSCFLIFTPLTSDNGFVGQALPLAIPWIGRRRACPTVLLTDNRQRAASRRQRLITRAPARTSYPSCVTVYVAHPRSLRSVFLLAPCFAGGRAQLGELLALYNR